MNNKNISLFNYVYSSVYEEDKSDDLKWQEFEKLCLEKMKYVPYDFVVENESLVTLNKKGMWQDLSGGKGIVGKFVILNFLGQKEYINYKVNELKAIISNYGNEAFKNLEDVFDNMCNEAIREILNECRNIGLISFDNSIFRYYDNRLGTIIYVNIKVVMGQSNMSQGSPIVYGTYISQQGNGNVANVNNISDEKLFELLDSKIEAIKMEMKNNDCKDKLEKLENAIKMKDKKSVLSILSELASIGSFIAAMIIK